ncbi:hypothetical protein [Acidipila rosea]|nr:hypothetical protein [Acidipila rosea]
MLDVFAPPIITAIWWLFSAGWSGLLGTSESDVVKSWRRPAMWTVLAVCYILMFGITAYAYFFRHR